MSAAQELTAQLQGQWRAGRGMAKCPAHDDHSPSLSIADGADGRLLLRCFAGCAYCEVRDALRRAGFDMGHEWQSIAQAAATLPYPTGCLPYTTGRERSVSMLDRGATNRAVWAERIWSRAHAIPGTLAQTYLNGRGLNDPQSATLRYAADCVHGGGIAAPAMVARIDGGDGFAIHRTYLPRDRGAVALGRKSDLAPNRKMLGPARGGAVRISDAVGPLVVAEGIETALAVRHLHFAQPVRLWAALSTSGLTALRLPAEVGRLVICADGDAPGRKAAQGLAERAYALGWRVELLTAPDGMDWNDVLLRDARCVP